MVYIKLFMAKCHGIPFDTDTDPDADPGEKPGSKYTPGC